MVGAFRELSAQEIARLEALRRLAMGAVHSLNNAFAAAVGEASFLREDRKHDALVVEACDTILGCLDRCARITRALLTRRNPSQGDRDDVDLGRLLRELGAFLAETLGRGHPLSLELPDDLLTVRGGSQRIELALLILIHYAVEAGGATAGLRLSADRADGQVRIHLQVATTTPAAAMAAALRDAALAPDPLTRICLEAFGALLKELGGSSDAEASDEHALGVSVRLPSIP